MSPDPAVRMQPPPKAVLRVVNPLLRRLLLSPLGDRMPPAMAVIEFTGRRSGRRYAVPVGVHDVPGGPVVFTESPWRRNFAGGGQVTVTRGRDRRRGRGVLVQDPDAVADALSIAVDKAGPRNLAMRVTPGHQITRADLVQLGRNMVRLELDSATGPLDR
ncbi:MAG TPA: hypothetical protein VFJ97_06560 [Dermatophilaceae bacterium]|nr:hypothetical protein [Dermatophilaceae bacterium]